MHPELLATLCALAELPRRTAAVAVLAGRLGVSEALFLVRDPQLDVLLPPVGFPQTLAGGRAWRAFLKKGCAVPGRHEAVVDFPTGEPSRRAVALVGERIAVVLFGGPVDEAALAELHAAFPLLSAIFAAEHAVRLAEGQAAVARTTGRRAQELALALDAARGEVERALDESARLNEELKDDDRRKDEFLAMLGHELRNPLSAIGAALEVARTGHDAEQSTRARAIIERQTAQLTRLVDDLLDVARVTRGKIELRLETVDVDAVVRRAIESTQALITSKGHSVEVTAAGPVFAKVDRARLEQMVTNLLTNAAKYTDQGGRIRVGVRRDGADAVVRVEDSGIGIRASMLQAIFDPFVQVTPTIDRGAGGLGIGLTLVRRLAVLHGGTVEAQSEPGAGSVFTLRLRAADPPEALTASGAFARAKAQKKRVLVVDDNLDSAEMLVALAATWGHEAVHAGDGPTALAIAAEMGPDVVLLDIGLPGMDGYEVAVHLRKAPGTCRSRIVAVSGYGHDGDRARSRDAGCDDHLVKPVNLEALRRAIEQ